MSSTDRKRGRSPPAGNADASVGDVPNKRRSRFGDATPVVQLSSIGNIDSAAILKAQVDARVAAIAKNLSSNTVVPSSSTLDLAHRQAQELQAQVAAQLANVTSILTSGRQYNSKKAPVRELRLDDQGREIDEFNQVIAQVAPQVKTLAANVMAEKAVQAANKKKDNPYLAHRAVAVETVVSTVGGVPIAPTVPIGEAAVENTGIDERLMLRNKRREGHLRRAFHFVEEGIYAKEEEKLQQKEERKMIAGYASGRKAPEKLTDVDGDKAKADASTHESSATSSVNFLTTVPPPVDSHRIVPVMEWWDEAYLPKNGWGEGADAVSLPQLKKQLQLAAVVTSRHNSTAVNDSKDISDSATSSAADSVPTLWQPRVSSLHQSHASSSGATSTTNHHFTVSDFYNMLSLIHCKTHKYVQHPVAPKPLGGDVGEDAPLPVYLTQKERKRIRKQAREERERNKRDMQMMGLIPAAEPKFKLSNFMKVLGDQAVADPSKIEQKVIQQMRKREMNHEMRNQARKLTPMERKEKEKRKNLEDTSKIVHVAVFKVCDLSDKKKQFKVDVTAQQHHLSGIVLLSTNEEVPTCLVVAEGGPRGISNFIKLMTRRIPWKIASDAYTNPKNAVANAAAAAAAMNEDRNKPDEGDDNSDAEDNDTEEQVDRTSELSLVTKPLIDPSLNECNLLWQGVLAKRTFTGFKFQEFRTAASARKALEPKSAQHYWDMAIQHGCRTQPSVI